MQSSTSPADGNDDQTAGMTAVTEHSVALEELKLKVIFLASSNFRSVQANIDSPL